MQAPNMLSEGAEKGPNCSSRRQLIILNEPQQLPCPSGTHNIDRGALRAHIETCKQLKQGADKTIYICPFMSFHLFLS